MFDTMFLSTGTELSGMVSPWFSSGFILLIAWSLIWKGWALWISARKDSKLWFVALLILNTVGILEILYIFFFSKRGEKKIEKVSEDVIKEELESQEKEDSSN